MQLEDTAALKSAAPAAGARELPATLPIIAYFSMLALASGLGSPGTGIAALPISYYLKDVLHLTPLELATFGAVAAGPAYVAFLFGFLRDRWRPRQLGDRAYLLWGALGAAASYLCLGTIHIDYRALLGLVLLAGISYLVIGAGGNAMATGVAQGNAMSGRLSVVALVGSFVPATIAAVAGGWLVASVSPAIAFVSAAGVTLLIAAQAFWKLDAVTAFEVTEEHPRDRRGLEGIARLIRHRPIWPATAIFFLWNFSPGWQTPMFYHLTQTVKISAEAYGYFVALQAICYLPTTLLYAPMCKRFTLRTLLLVSTLSGVVQGVAMLGVRSETSALVAGALAGLLGGFPTAAYIDLIIRSCPKGLEGTGITLATSTAIAVSVNSGNLFGSWVYAHGGFNSAIVVSILATVAILPILPLVPRNVTESREGELLDESALL